LIAERSVVAPRDTKLQRLRRSIVDASKQCRRGRLMVLEGPTPWTELAGACSTSMRFLADPDGRPPPRWPAIPRGRDLVLAVGPEGGFTTSERALADQAGWLPINLSVNTLRIETAGLAGCAALLARIGETDPSDGPLTA
jgi:16S rRNA (uracil1498-N3)-methyltransferase